MNCCEFTKRFLGWFRIWLTILQNCQPIFMINPNHPRFLLGLTTALLLTLSLCLTAWGQRDSTGVVVNNANLRAGPGVTYALVGKAAAGQTVTIAGKNASGDWYHLSNGQWIAAFLVTFNADPVTPSAAINHPTTSIITTVASAKRDANLRSGPGVTYALAGTVSTSQALTLTGQTSDGLWYQLAGGEWIAAFLVNTSSAPSLEQAVSPTPPAATPAPTSADPAPATSGNDFVMVQKHLWDPYENGGSLDGPSVHCGLGRELIVNVLDANGQRLNGVAVQVIYGAREIYVTGSQGKGDGVAEFVLGKGQDVQVIRDTDGRAVTSDIVRGLSTDPHEIATDALIASRYCQDAATCQDFAAQNSCDGHFSWTVTFQRK